MASIIRKAIKDYEGYYEVDNIGRVYSLIRNNGLGSRLTEKTLSLKETKQGRWSASLSKNGSTKQKLVHRLVADAFIPNPKNKPCINHKDGIPLNNEISNLEWCTYKENDTHARKMKLYGGEKHNLAKLTEKDVRYIREVYPEKSSWKLSKEFNVKDSTILNVIHRRTWKHVT